MKHIIKNPQQINQFWLDAGMQKWFVQNDDFDVAIKNNFLQTHQAAQNRHLQDWINKPETITALIILLDQFSRNIFRGKPQAFENDPYALEIAKFAVNKEFDRKLDQELKILKSFLYMPYMHSEKIEEQDECIRLFKNAGLTHNIEHAKEHRDTIKRFGRFPHRNDILGRKSTKEEIDFLQRGGLNP